MKSTLLVAGLLTLAIAACGQPSHEKHADTAAPGAAPAEIALDDGGAPAAQPVALTAGLANEAAGRAAEASQPVETGAAKAVAPPAAASDGVAQPPPVAADTSCPPEHAAMGHCTPEVEPQE